MNDNSPLENPVDAKKAAQLCGLSDATFQRGVKTGWLPLPVYPMPRSPRWFPSELRAAMLRRRKTPTEAKEERRQARLAAQQDTPAT
jgi:predicted DNA-binding transcriptional regulator AlpA